MGTIRVLGGLGLQDFPSLDTLRVYGFSKLGVEGLGFRALGV